MKISLKQKNILNRKNKNYPTLIHSFALELNFSLHHQKSKI